jgi:hypothetical protein
MPKRDGALDIAVPKRLEGAANDLDVVFGHGAGVSRAAGRISRRSTAAGGRLDLPLARANQIHEHVVRHRPARREPNGPLGKVESLETVLDRLHGGRTERKHAEVRLGRPEPEQRTPGIEKAGMP